MDKHGYKRTQGVISVHAHIVENINRFASIGAIVANARDNDSRVACPHPPYEGQVRQAGDKLAGIDHSIALHDLVGHIFVQVRGDANTNLRLHPADVKSQSTHLKTF